MTNIRRLMFWHNNNEGHERKAILLVISFIVKGFKMNKTFDYFNLDITTIDGRTWPAG